jgi:L-ectoine synthase
MIVRSLEEIAGSERDVAWGNGQSRRFLLDRDGMGYSLTDTTVTAGSESHLEYKNHLEACYCISGEGEVECAGRKYPIIPGTLYALDKHEPHVLRARTEMRLICVFTPALKGPEAHRLGDRGTPHSHY